MIRKALNLIPAALIRKSGLIIILLIISSLLDFLSVSSFIPVLVLIIKPDAFLSIQAIADFQESTGFNSQEFAVVLTLVAIFSILIKSEVNKRITYRKALYAYRVAMHIASNMLDHHFQSSYEGFTNKDYTKELNRISNLPLTFANNFIVPAGTIISEGIIALLLSAIICYFNAGLFFLLLAIGASSLMLFRLQKLQIQSTNKQIKTSYPRILKYALEAIEAFVETRVFKKEFFFKKRFNEAYETLGNTLAKDHVLNSATSRTTEMVVAVCLGVLIIFSLLTGKSGDELILLLSIYAGASFRMIPSINRIFGAYMQIKTHEYVLDELNKRESADSVVNDHAVFGLTFKDKLELKDLGFCYNGHRAVVKNCSISIKQGEKIIISGKSGSGKTTLLLLLMRCLKSSEGTIYLDDEKISDSNASVFEQLFGYVSQNPYILDASISENIAFGTHPEKIDLEKVNSIVEDLDLASWINNLPAGLNTSIGEKGTKISGGQRQRIAIARALYHGSQILLLDEITNQLDHQTEWEVMQALKNISDKNKTIVLITHRPDLWTWFDSYYELKNGSLEKLKSAIIQNA